MLESRPTRGPVEFVARTAELQRQIDNFILLQNSELKQKATSHPQFKALENVETIKSLIQTAGVRGAIDSVKKNRWTQAGFQLITQIVEEQMKLIQDTSSAIAELGSRPGEVDPMRIFILSILNEYFSRLSPTSRKQILSQMIGSNLNASSLERFELMVLSSGPQFQKLLQIMAREAGMPAELLKVFKRLESKAMAVPPQLVRDLFEAERARYNWVRYDVKPLGTGTMAQVHKGAIRIGNREQEVVIRFLKPEVAERVAEDYRILRELAPIIDANPVMKAQGFPKVTPLVEDLNKTVTDELSLKDTVDRQLQANQVYEKQLFFNGREYKNYVETIVPEVYAFEPSSKLHVQELLRGEKLDKVAELYRDSIPDLKRGLIEEITRMWIQELIFGSGFFHSDLHQGNFMVDFSDEKIRVALLDYGMGGSISRHMQAQILILSAGIELNRADILTEALWNLRDAQTTTLTLAEFSQMVGTRVREIQTGRLPYQSLDRWSAWAINSGLRFPYSFVSMNRGLVILDKSLKEAGSNKTVTSIGKSIAPHFVLSIIGDLRLGGKLSWAEITRLGWIVATKNPQAPAALAAVGRSCKAVYLK
jgi:predicted unusual protein kinase regulating ubiquinone biosynthesis (AarF/ABC1/UbiB family)